MNNAFKEELTKLAKKDNDFQKGLLFGGISGVASVTAGHPLEHKLYGGPKTGPFFKHYRDRLGKGVIASTVGYGSYHYLSSNEKAITKWWDKNVKRWF